MARQAAMKNPDRTKATATSGTDIAKDQNRIATRKQIAPAPKAAHIIAPEGSHRSEK